MPRLRLPLDMDIMRQATLNVVAVHPYLDPGEPDADIDDEIRALLRSYVKREYVRLGGPVVEDDSGGSSVPTTETGCKPSKQSEDEPPAEDDEEPDAAALLALRILDMTTPICKAMGDCRTTAEFRAFFRAKPKLRDFAAARRAIEALFRTEGLEQMRAARAKIAVDAGNPPVRCEALYILDKLFSHLELARVLEGLRGTRRSLRDVGNIVGYWRMLIDDNIETFLGEPGEFAFENECGYLEGMMDGFALMLSTLDQPLDADLYLRLHDICTEWVYTRGTHDVRGTDARFIPGYRVHTNPARTSYPRAGNFSVDGLAELRARLESEGGSPWLRIEDAEVVCEIRSADQCRARVNTIFAAYATAMSTAGNEDARLAAMVRCCQDLDQSHVFYDANLRVAVFLVLPRLLILNDLPLTIFDDPNVFDGHSTAELVRLIKDGRDVFRGALEHD